jgi:myo-inositol 2-dehydrogenase / D-chiro-inositol 1-dehydrogenase
LRVGIVGAGSMAETHLTAWAAEGVPAVVYNRDADRAAALAGRLGARVARSFEELLHAVDVVDICTSTDRHATAAVAAAGAGRHVICEKPLARTLEEGVAMVAACERAGVGLFVAQVVRFFPEYEAAQRLVAGGVIGDPAVLRLKREGFRPQHPAGHWLWDAGQSGGLIVDLMIHDFDYARWVAGDVGSVQCRSVGVERPELGVDHAFAILTHTSGAISHVTGSWAMAAPTFRTSLEIAGSRGLVEHDSEVSKPIVTYLHPRPADGVGAAPVKRVGLPASPVREDPYRLELREFYRAIVEGAPVRVSARDGLEALRIALAADESARSGRVLRLNAASMLATSA